MSIVNKLTDKHYAMPKEACSVVLNSLSSFSLRSFQLSQGNIITDKMLEL